MRDVIYLIVKRTGITTMKKKPPVVLSGGEHCIKVIVNVPDTIFRNTIPTITIDVPEPEEVSGSEIDMEVEWQ